jgi:hypothetical protein
MHFCAYHNEDHPVDRFLIKKNGKLDSWCHEGRKEYNREYSKKSYAPIKEEVAEKIGARENRTEQVCTICSVNKSIEDFRFRYDRPDKRESRCIPCLKIIRRSEQQIDSLKHADKRGITRRKWQAAHPRYNEQSSRTRRARMKVVRRERYTRKQVRERDNGLCWFCNLPVDPSLKWPDPLSEVVHHHHPISKKGPDCLENVALAHNECNGHHHAKYESPFLNWSVISIDNALARKTAVENHYLHRAPNVSFGFGLYSPENKLQGIVTFGSPSSNRITKSVCPNNDCKVIELNRLWIDDTTPFGAASWLVSRALKELPPMIIVSYADTDIVDSRNERNHDGSIYRALSFDYAGQSKAKTEYRMPGGTRNVGKITPGSVKSKISSKKRFWTVTGNKREKRILRDICNWNSLPYEQ